MTPSFPMHTIYRDHYIPTRQHHPELSMWKLRCTTAAIIHQEGSIMFGQNLSYTQFYLRQC